MGSGFIPKQSCLKFFVYTTMPPTPVNRGLLTCAAVLCIIAVVLLLLLPGESLMADLVYGAF